MTDPNHGTVVVIDDDESVRNAICGLVETIALNAIPLGSVEEFLKATPPLSPSCIILDVRLPGASGLDLQNRLLGAKMPTPIVFITGHGDIPMSVQAMKAGAIEFLAKPFREQDLLDAVRQGVERYRASLAQQRTASQAGERYATLSDREKQIMALLVAGRVTKQIAGELDISEVTIRVHRRRIMQKMGAHSLADLVRMADQIKTE